ncbi:tRNA modification GTPase MnmE [Dirofilaria immitis]
MPQLWEKILAEKSVPHPSAEHRPTIMVNRECLQHFVDIVPLLNVEKFKEKLESKDVILSVINNSGHYLPLGKEFEKLFDSLICSVQQIMR